MSQDVAHEAVTEQQFLVVVNHEEQYSIWPAGRQLPAGWQSGGPEGSREDCLAYIEDTWTDMRPKSLREAMDGRPPSEVAW
jgi:MbtH protein